MVHTIALIAAIALLIPGIFMSFVPMLPALSYMFVMALAFGIFDRFAALSVGETLGLLCIALVSIAVDHTAGLLGAKYGGAHSKSLLWGILGAFIGLFTLPAFGSFVGLFLGVLFAELYYREHHPDKHKKAVKAAGSALVGSAVGVAVNVVLSVIFFGLFLFFVL